MSRPGEIDVVMPQMGESLAEGTIVRWLKSAGDRVNRDEPIVEIATDKVDTDLPAPSAGILTTILVGEGQTVAVGATIGIIASDDARQTSTPAAATIPSVPSTAAAAEESGGHFKSSHAPQLVSFRRGSGAPTPAHSNAAAPAAAPARAAAAGGPPNRSYSPGVLDAAKRGGVPLDVLTTLQGSGRGGRITKRDVQRFLDSAGASPAPARPAASGPVPQVSATTPESVPAEYAYRPGPGDRLEPMSIVRRRIAHHMTWSTRISPHATAQAEADMSEVAAILRLRDNFREAFGVPLTYTVFAAAAAVRALGEFPVLNSSVVGDAIAFKPHINLGVAVALTDSEDLIVPVVRKAEELGIVGLARALHDLATRARARQLLPEDVQSGTFTLTNPGVFGGITGTPILNQPQVAILGLGAVRNQPVAVEDAIAVRPVMALALTFDHRAADGMVAFRYLGRVRELLEHPPSDWRWTA